MLGEEDVGVVLNEWIHEHHFELIAMGTTGRSDFRRLVLGSIAEEARLQAIAWDTAARKSGLRPTLRVEVGRPVDTILKIASQLGVGLIVLGASAPHRLVSRLGRTIAYRIVPGDQHNQ